MKVPICLGVLAIFLIATSENKGFTNFDTMEDYKEDFPHIFDIKDATTPAENKVKHLKFLLRFAKDPEIISELTKWKEIYQNLAKSDINDVGSQGRTKLETLEDYKTEFSVIFDIKDVTTREGKTLLMVLELLIQLTRDPQLKSELITVMENYLMKFDDPNPKKPKERIRRDVEFESLEDIGKQLSLLRNMPDIDINFEEKVEALDIVLRHTKDPQERAELERWKAMLQELAGMDFQFSKHRKALEEAPLAFKHFEDHLVSFLSKKQREEDEARKGPSEEIEILDSELPWYLWVLLSMGAILVIGGVVALVLLLLKKRKEDNQGSQNKGKGKEKGKEKEKEKGKGKEKGEKKENAEKKKEPVKPEPPGEDPSKKPSLHV